MCATSAKMDLLSLDKTSGSEITTKVYVTTGVGCGNFCLLKPRKPRLKNVNSCMLVKFEEFKSKIHVLSSCVVLQSLKSLERWSIKMPLRNYGFCCIRSQREQKTDIGSLCCSSLL